MQRAPLALFLLLALAACSGGSPGTGLFGGADGGDAASSAGDGGTALGDSAAGAAGDSSSADSAAVPPGGDGGAPGCGTMDGTWNLAGQCGADRCEVSQTGCSLRVLCNEEIDYMGTVTGASFTYSGTDPNGYVHTCTGTIEGTSLSGSCSVTSSGSCTFTATH